MRSLPRRAPLLASLVIGAGMLAAGCGEPPSLPPPEQAGELVVLVRPGPGMYYPGPDGEAAGFDTALARLFAAEKKLPVRFVTADSDVHLLEAVARGEAHIGAGGLYRPVASPATDSSGQAAAGADSGDPAARLADAVLWTAGYRAVEPVLIYNAEGFRPASWKDLAGQTVVYREASGLEAAIAAARNAHPEVDFTAVALPSAAALVAQVSDGRIGYAIVASDVAALSRNAYLGYEVAFPVGGRRELGWAVMPGVPALRDELDAFFDRLRRSGALQRLADRYFTFVRQVPRIDAAVFQERIRTMLPDYRRLFQAAQEQTGLEWRLLAAIAYQESQWDPLATSETGVRGIMQITEDTARHLGILDRLDPGESIAAAARYIRDLKDKLPARIAEPDRTWLALAAFNIGLGHLEDARVIAQKQKLNPDSWSDVKKALPLLALPEYYEQARNGFARGGMPVAFVDRVRAYYDVLLAQQPAYVPRLRAASGFAPAEPPVAAAAK
jgi:membrane-bound lytic murein transglycosylase F